MSKPIAPDGTIGHHIFTITLVVIPVIASFRIDADRRIWSQELEKIHSIEATFETTGWNVI